MTMRRTITLAIVLCGPFIASLLGFFNATVCENFFSDIYIFGSIKNILECLL